MPGGNSLEHEPSLLVYFNRSKRKCLFIYLIPTSYLNRCVIWTSAEPVTLTTGGCTGRSLSSVWSASPQIRSKLVLDFTRAWIYLIGNSYMNCF
jgi:hypothetical protein